MWGPATALAVAEQYRIAEEYPLKVRAELFRLRCSGEIIVEQEETALKLIYGGASVIKQPMGLLTTLQEIYQVECAEHLWVLLQQDNAENHKVPQFIAVLLALVMLMVLTMVIIDAYP